jgi:integrase
MDPNVPVGDIKTAWEAAKAKAGVQSRFHDLRHTACTRLLERGTSLSVVASIMGRAYGGTLANGRKVFSGSAATDQ